MSAIVPFADLQNMATAVVRSGLFGIKNADQAIALMLVAQAEGVHPMVAARDYDIIQGRPALKSRAMLARFQQTGGKVEWVERSDTACAAKFSHPSSPAPLLIRWDMKRAQNAGLTGKDNWRKFPAQMLSARVVSEGVNACYPAACNGMYTPEEVQDFDNKPEVVKQADVIEQDYNQPIGKDSQEFKDMGDGFDRSQPVDATVNTTTGEVLDGAPPDRDIIIHFNGKGKPPSKKRCSECTADDLAKAVECARDRYKKAKGEYADKNKREATEDAEAAKAWAAYRANQQPAGDVPPEPEPEAPAPQEPPKRSYGDLLDEAISASEHGHSRAVAEASKVDYTRLVEAVNDKLRLTNVELTKLEAVGVNVATLWA